MWRSRVVRVVAVVGAAVVVPLIWMPAATAGDGDDPVRYVAPVDGPVVDHFRPPATPWSAGNRGLEYATTPGATVRATARGVVRFAGPIGARRYASIDHPDGVRSTYSGLATVDVLVGDTVVMGERIGSAADRLHFGIRVGDVYLDPAIVLAGSGSGSVRLVPHQEVAEYQATSAPWWWSTHVGGGSGLGAIASSVATSVALLGQLLTHGLPLAEQ